MSHWRAAGSFDDEACTALYALIEHNDVVDQAAAVPTAARTRLDEPTLAACYGLSLALWERGVARQELVALLRPVLRTGVMPAEARARFKALRARFKQLRFACALFHASHAYPRFFHMLTASLGHLQDALKSDCRWQARHYALRAWVLTRRGTYAIACREVQRCDLTSASAFHAYQRREMERAAAMLDGEDVTGREFHQLRKIVSRQLAGCNALAVLAPTPWCKAIRPCLTTINGLMGARHDDLVAECLAGTRSEEAKVCVRAEVIALIREVVAWYQVAMPGELGQRAVLPCEPAAG